MKKLIIKKTKGVTEEGITATEKFQRVFLQAFESVEKIPTSIKDLFLSNIIYRTFSHVIYRTIDEKNASFFPEKIKSSVTKYSVSNTSDTYVYLDDNLVRRSRYIGLEIANDSSTSSCNIHIRSGEISIGNIVSDDTYFFTVPPQTSSSFQFLCSFTTIYIIMRQQTHTDDVYLKTYYLPL